MHDGLFYYKQVDYYVKQLMVEMCFYGNTLIWNEKCFHVMWLDMTMIYHGNACCGLYQNQITSTKCAWSCLLSKTKQKVEDGWFVIMAPITCLEASTVL